MEKIINQKEDIKEEQKEDKKEDIKEDIKEDRKEDIKEDRKEDIKEDIKEDRKEEIKEDRKEDIKEDRKEDITILNSITENWLSWLFIIVSVSIVSYPNCLVGFFTFIVFLILHHYHHENNNFFSHISQILTELAFPVLFIPLYFIFGTTFFNEWILLLFPIFYSSVHNINYGFFRVNDVHYLHHQFVQTNIGPDICDIIFNTKNNQNINVENTNHYIPNIIIGTILVLIVKHFYYKSDEWKSRIHTLMYSFLGLSFLFSAISSIYLYFYYKHF